MTISRPFVAIHRSKRPITDSVAPGANASVVRSARASTDEPACAKTSRIGIGHPGDKNKVVGFVLGKPPASEQKMIDEAIDESLRCTEMLMKDGLEKTVQRLHSFKAQA